MSRRRQVDEQRALPRRLHEPLLVEVRVFQRRLRRAVRDDGFGMRDVVGARAAGRLQAGHHHSAHRLVAGVYERKFHLSTFPDAFEFHVSRAARARATRRP